MGLGVSGAERETAANLDRDVNEERSTENGSPAVRIRGADEVPSPPQPVFSFQESGLGSSP